MISKRNVQLVCLCIGMLLITLFGVFSSTAESCSFHAQAYDGLTLPKLTQELEHTGLIGRIHGARFGLRFICFVCA